MKILTHNCFTCCKLFLFNTLLCSCRSPSKQNLLTYMSHLSKHGKTLHWSIGRNLNPVKLIDHFHLDLPSKNHRLKLQNIIRVQHRIKCLHPEKTEKRNSPQMQSQKLCFLNLPAPAATVTGRKEKYGACTCPYC